MELFLLRHARPEPHDTSLYPEDWQRPLTVYGRQEHSLMMQALAPLLMPLDHLLCSPLVRARQTAELTATLLHFPGAIEETSLLGADYSPGAMLRHFQTYPRHARLLCVGHAPELRQFAAVCLDGEGRSTVALQQSALLGLTFPGHPLPGAATLRFFLCPEDLLRFHRPR